MELPAVTASALLELKGDKKLYKLNSDSKFCSELDKLPEGFSIAGTKTTSGTTFEEVSADLKATKINLSAPQASNYTCSVLSLGLRVPCFTVEQAPYKHFTNQKDYVEKM